jgi:WD40 repeat protein
LRSYENVTILEDHSSTLTSIKFAEERSTKNQKRLKLLSCGADKQIILRNVDMPIVEQNDVKKLQEKKTEEFLVVQKKEQCKYKTFSMDIAHSAGYIVTGHDKFLQLWQLSNCEKVWEKKPESIRKSGTLD